MPDDYTTYDTLISEADAAMRSTTDTTTGSGQQTTALLDWASRHLPASEITSFNQRLSDPRTARHAVP